MNEKATANFEATNRKTTNKELPRKAIKTSINEPIETCTLLEEGTETKIDFLDDQND